MATASKKSNLNLYDENGETHFKLTVSSSEAVIDYSQPVCVKGAFSLGDGVSKIADVKTTIEGIQQDIVNSGAAATNAQAALQSNIDSEEAARIAADLVLQTHIDTESSARVAADAQLQTAIDTEHSARVAADLVLQTHINSEIAARTTAIADLQSQLDFVKSNTDPQALDSLTELLAEFQNADNTLASTIMVLQSRLTATQARLDQLQADFDGLVD